MQQPSFLWTSLSFLFLLPQLACSGNANSDNSKLENISQQPDWDFSLESNPKQGFYCTANGQSFGHLIFHEDGTIEIHPEQSIAYQGSYTVEDDRWNIQAPAFQFEESTTLIEQKLGMVGRFTTPSLSCHAVGWEADITVSGRYQCSPRDYIENTSYEDDLFEFGPNGDVFRSNRLELLQGDGDTIYNRSNGIYRVVEDSIYMYFGDSSIEQELNGSISEGNWLKVNDLYDDTSCDIE